MNTRKKTIAPTVERRLIHSKFDYGTTPYGVEVEEDEAGIMVRFFNRDGGNLVPFRQGESGEWFPFDVNPLKAEADHFNHISGNKGYFFNEDPTSMRSFGDRVFCVLRHISSGVSE